MMSRGPRPVQPVLQPAVPSFRDPHDDRIVGIRASDRVPVFPAVLLPPRAKRRFIEDEGVSVTR